MSTQVGTGIGLGLRLKRTSIRLRSHGPAVRAGRAARDGQRGQGMVEYALIVLLMVLICIILVAAIGGQVKNDYSNIANSFPP